jgi:hypothetical protein
MSAELHGFQPEEVMAYLDGEITGERALALADHLQQCAECSALADDFCSLSQQLIAWKIEPSPLVDSLAILGVEALTAEEAMGAFKFDKESIAAFPPAHEPAPMVGRKSTILSSFLDFIWRPRVQRPWVWALASACVVILIVSSLSLRMVKVTPSQSVYPMASRQTKTQNAKRDSSPTTGPAVSDPLSVAGARARANTVTVDGADAADNSVNGLHAESLQNVTGDKLGQLKARQEAFKRNDETSEKITALDTSVHSELATKVSTDEVDTAVVPAQLIERTASLSITVKEMDAARAAIEDIEKRHRGYFADLNTEGQSEAGRTLTASLRVPADELDATLIELRKLGHLDEEKQGGEEVTQQHVDLQARLKNARNTERRLTDLLTKRADKLKDVLDVERELASTREEIERMEAQLRNMENQVSYAAIDLKLREEYKPALNLAPPATGTRLRNALVDGYKSAVESALGLILFLFQEGPTILFWLLLLFFPARWTWRKLRALAAQKQSLAGAL